METVYAHPVPNSLQSAVPRVTHCQSLFHDALVGRSSRRRTVYQGPGTGELEQGPFYLATRATGHVKDFEDGADRAAFAMPACLARTTESTHIIVRDTYALGLLGQYRCCVHRLISRQTL